MMEPYLPSCCKWLEARKKKKKETSSASWWVRAVWQEICGQTVGECIFGGRLNISSTHLLHTVVVWLRGIQTNPTRAPIQDRVEQETLVDWRPHRMGFGHPCSNALSGVHLEFHSTFCLSLRLRKPGLMCVDTQGLPLWKSHWKMTKLVTEMVKMSWLNGSMATCLCCGKMEKEDGHAVLCMPRLSHGRQESPD